MMLLKKKKIKKNGKLKEDFYQVLRSYKYVQPYITFLT
jgi:hypothetical protein